MNTGLRNASVTRPNLLRRLATARTGFAALFIWTLAVTLWRTRRLPNDYAEAQWLLTWEFGFVKRGLPGTLLAWSASLLSARVTPFLLASVATALFAAFCGAKLFIAFRIGRRAAWSPGAVLTCLVFLSSPFFVMQMDVIGYFDGLILATGALSVALVARDRPWSAAALQALALLVHEQSLALAYPAVVFCTAMNHRYGRPKHKWQNWLALIVPLAAFVVLALIWERTTTPDVIAQYGSKLKLAGFVGENRDVWAPEWLFRSFLDSYRAESPLFQRRRWPHPDECTSRSMMDTIPE